jgi:hypothetical protein
MPELTHQAIIQILRDEPQIVVALLGHIGFKTPPGSYPVIADTDLSHRSARLLKELRADNVFLFPGMDETIAVVVEVQKTRPDNKRQRAWPCYVTSARAIHECKTYMLVIATSQAASNGSAELIEIGQPRFQFLPFVAGGHVSLPSPGGLVFGPEWMMLNILTGRFKLSTHTARMFALASIASASPDRCEEYANTILGCSSKSIRQALEKLMKTTFESPFIASFRKQGLEEGRREGRREGREEGRAEGRAEGRVEEAASALLTVLTARGISVIDQVRTLISACTDLDQLEKWTVRAATATTIDEVFA